MTRTKQNNRAEGQKSRDSRTRMRVRHEALTLHSPAAHPSFYDRKWFDLFTGSRNPAHCPVKKIWSVPGFFLSVGFFPFSNFLAAPDLLLWHALVRAAAFPLPVVPCI